jgi:hypothetical protein
VPNQTKGSQTEYHGAKSVAARVQVSSPLGSTLKPIWPHVVIES